MESNSQTQSQQQVVLLDLSVFILDLLSPEKIKKNGQRTYRSITIEGEEFDFSGGFTDLHTASYQEILKGNGFGIDETKEAIEIVHDIRHIEPIGLKGDYHPFAKHELGKHPFLSRKGD